MVTKLQPWRQAASRGRPGQWPAGQACERLPDVGDRRAEGVRRPRKLRQRAHERGELAERQRARKKMHYCLLR
jgi:hypothetical protein